MARKYRLVVGASETGLRLDQYLVRRIPRSISRRLIQRLVQEGSVTVDGCPSKAHRRLHRGEIVCAEVKFLPDPAASTPLSPQDIPLQIVYEDSHLLVVNKPPGLVTHPAPGHWDGTLVNAILWHLEKGRKARSKTQELPRAGIVHRLDKDTSGALLVAKTATCHTALAKQLEARRIRRTYCVLVEGHMPLDSGMVNTSIGRHAIHRKEMAVQYIRGRTAITQYRVVKRFGEVRSVRRSRARITEDSSEVGALGDFAYTLLEVSLGTGRTHQIRVHMAHLGFPVLGDVTYGRRPASFWQSMGIARQMLHAHKLGFEHPVSGKIMALSATIPEDLAQWISGVASE